MIIFFDGVCLMCNRFVDFILRHDHERRFRFAPIQGARAREMVPAEILAEFNTMALYNQGQVLVRSDAVLTVLTELFPLLKVCWLVPRSVRDVMYRFISHNRYNWFGKRETCRLPTPEERERFLD